MVRDARVVLDRNKNSQPLTSLGDIDTLTVDEIIESKVEDAARLVTANAAHYLLDAGKALTGGIAWESQAGYGRGRVNLPADFLRLLTFQMSDWARPVTEAITEAHPLYGMQSSRYAGIRGNSQQPVVAIVHQATESGLALEFYSSEGASAHIKLARYIPVPRIEDGYIGLCAMLRGAVVYRMASMAATTIGEGDLAAAMLATSNELAGISES